MNARRLLYPGIAAVGIAALGAFAYYTQREPQGATEKTASASVKPGGPPAARPGGAPGGPVSVDVAKVASTMLVDDINAVGTLRSNESIVVRPEVSGRITRLNFGDGQPVKKGQVLVSFDSSVNQAEVQQARAELGIAKANFERNADLARQNFLSTRARDESAANVQVLEAKLALAEARLAKFEIRAPFSGIVGMRTVSIGDYVKDGADLVNLEDISSVKVDFRVPERFADRVRPGQELEVAVDALPTTTFKAKVDAVDPQIDSSGRSALLRGRIPNAQVKLKPGMFARVKLILAEREDAMMIPEEAIVPQGNKSTVWKVVDGKAVRTEVRTGMRRDAKVEITDGLSLGDTVVIAGQMRLSRDGSPVRISNMADDPAQSAGQGGKESRPEQRRANAVSPSSAAPAIAKS
jgi:membrane fusion protein (multidrug efflux system)